ncbi:hypothetical protein IFM89_009622 [Coptis chinensis]|uniref:Uncharacterized protein n=1 Tax=Coptis chinensis TaxID=261450 RepID=A0A835MEQ7_9MAGN|nr:hypothetical protein IFM89_009622 [Coptis chinensis]
MTLEITRRVIVQFLPSITEGSGSPFRGSDIPPENSLVGTAVEPREHLSPTAHNSSLRTLELQNSPGKMLADSEAEKILKYIGVLNSQEEEKPPDTETSTPSRWADLIEEGEIEEPNHIDENSRGELWTELQHISNANLPWLLMGDFNAYLSCSEKQGDPKIVHGLGSMFWARESGPKPNSFSLKRPLQLQLASTDFSSTSAPLIRSRLKPLESSFWVGRFDIR